MAIQGPPPIKVVIRGQDDTGPAFKSAKGNAQSLEKFIGSSSDIAKGLGIIGAGAAIGLAAIMKLKDGLVEVLKLDQKFARLKFTEGFSDVEMDLVKKESRSIARETGVAQEEVIAAIDKVGDAGFKLNETFKIVRQGAKAAKAFGQPLSVFADQAFTLGANFGIVADKMDQALDVMAQVGTTNLDIDQLNQLLADAGTSAKALGLDGVEGLREMGAALQVVRTGVKDSGKGMKAFSGVLRDAVSDESIKKFKEGFGIDLVSEIKKGVKGGDSEFAAYLKAVRKVTKSSNTLDREQRFNFLFSGEQVGAVRALIDKLDDLQDAYKQTGKAQGTIERGFGLQRETDLQGLDEANQSVIATIQETGEAMRVQIGKQGLKRGSDARKILSQVDAQADSALVKRLRVDTNLFKSIQGPKAKKTDVIFGKDADQEPVIAPSPKSNTKVLIRPDGSKDSVSTERPSIFSGIKPPSQMPAQVPPPATTPKVEMNVRFENTPAGTQVRTKADNGVIVNPSMGMSWGK